MKYLCLVYFEQSVLDSLDQDAHSTLVRDSIAYDGELQERGHLIHAAALEPVSAATSVRLRNGQVMMTDGPFAETREVLGGFILVEAHDLAEAARLAADIPLARLGTIEVRPLRVRHAR
ncbi:YciI family protein [Zavarzinia sp. CC-PAN008]|uniref:YciI family protein n=1 Tax=Zavarzinia sp. CC-PAN008 TaxID=3243332 RepID=UPI003F746C16